jgi:hypothetical protein
VVHDPAYAFSFRNEKPPPWILRHPGERSTKTLCTASAAGWADLPALAPPAVATAARIVPASAKSTAATARGLRSCFVDVQSAPIQFSAVQMRNRLLCGLRIGHFHESKATGLPRIAIRYYIYSLDTTIGGESGMQVILRSLITEVSDKYVGHSSKILLNLQIIFVRQL